MGDSLDSDIAGVLAAISLSLLGYTMHRLAAPRRVPAPVTVG
ncbi:hypothetical protein [Streptomyces sp. HC307]